MGVRRSYRRSDLFLVRLWTEEAGDSTGADGSGISTLEWRGKVQRVTDGESRQFSDWQSLAEVLLAMLAKKEGR